MGKEIEAIAISRGHVISGKFDSRNPVTPEKLADTNVAIEFTRPELAVQHIHTCMESGCPVIVGTTGWYGEFEKIKEKVNDSGGSLLCATNFSLGVNIAFYINNLLAKIMQHYPEYAVEISEIHHTRKLDAPSGTAISLAEGIIKHHKLVNSWSLTSGKAETGVVPITAERTDDVPGTHTVAYKSDIDSIELTHIAHNRKGFALGSVMAAEWIIDKKGVFGMQDMLNFDALI